MTLKDRLGISDSVRQIETQAAVTDGCFRRKPYYRLNEIRIAIPPLRDLPDDILPLARLFMQEFTQKFHRDIAGFTEEAEQALLNHHWRGNEQELRNRVERAVALSQAPRISAHALGLSGAVEDMSPAPTLKTTAERPHIPWFFHKRSGDNDPDSGAPLAPTPVVPNRQSPRSTQNEVELLGQPLPLSMVGGFNVNAQGSVLAEE